MSKANGILIFAAYRALSTDWYQGCEGICLSEFKILSYV